VAHGGRVGEGVVHALAVHLAPDETGDAKDACLVGVGAASSMFSAIHPRNKSRGQCRLVVVVLGGVGNLRRP